MTQVLRLYSDFICPFCFIAEQGPLARLLEEWKIELDWRGFQLHPQTPVGGLPLDEYFPAERIPAMRDHMFRLAEHFGVEGLRFPERLSNTRRVLRLAELARDEGKLEPFRSRAMNAYWREGQDLESTDVLTEIAGAVGLPDDALHRADWDPAYDERVASIRDEADAMGISGIPTFIMGGYAVVGCQPYEALEQLAAAAGAERN